MAKQLRIIRAVCAGYAVLLTFLLLVPDPSAWLFGTIQPDVPSHGVHFTAFTILSFLFAACRLPWKLSVRIAVLVSYALFAELAQGLVEQRTVQAVDLAENFLGLAVGTRIWMRWNGRRSRRPLSEQ